MWTVAFLGGGTVFVAVRAVVAGVLFGLQAYKPHLALMIPVALLAGRQWRAFVAAGVTVGRAAARSASRSPDGRAGATFLDLTPLLRKVTLEEADGGVAPQRLGVHGGVAARRRA